MTDSVLLVENTLVRYTNWRGHVSDRLISPISLRYGVNEWHPEPQWLLLVYDMDKREKREFALKDMVPIIAERNSP